jgi:hypothetical protein
MGATRLVKLVELPHSVVEHETIIIICLPFLESFVISLVFASIPELGSAP